MWFSALVFVIFMVSFWGLWLTALVSIVRTPIAVFEADGRSKGLTTALVLLTGGVGGAYYWLAIHRELRHAID